MFYYENAQRYIYRSYLGLIGLAALLFIVFGILIGMPVYAGTH